MDLGNFRDCHPICDTIMGELGEIIFGGIIGTCAQQTMKNIKPIFLFFVQVI